VFSRFSVIDNLIMGGYHRADRNSLDEDIVRVFDLFPQLAERRKQMAGALSIARRADLRRRRRCGSSISAAVRGWTPKTWEQADKLEYGRAARAGSLGSPTTEEGGHDA
jgi:hypothetical protein